MKLFLLRIRTTDIEMLDREKIMFETSSTAGCCLKLNSSNCDCNDKSYYYGLNLPNIVSITWGMSLPGLEQGHQATF